MNAFEWVGFFISALSVLFLVGKGFYDAIQREKNPTKFQAQQEEAERRFKAFLRGESTSPTVGRILREVIEEDEEEDEEELLEQTHGRVPLKHSFPKAKASVVAPKQKQEIAPEYSLPKERVLPTVAKEGNSHVKSLLMRESSTKNMVILSEVFGTPKGLR